MLSSIRVQSEFRWIELNSNNATLYLFSIFYDIYFTLHKLKNINVDLENEGQNKKFFCNMFVEFPGSYFYHLSSDAKLKGNH